ncbi:Phytosulfokine [Cynara cardunculus var. scolymus]|uniref:Phytosulfokine n=1 Tax=Cynara cardunculus var. scolymus TaxID=59895 RepID=A0A103XD42_CYNCS|nr:Phytosulfokine [Cynara cardunculus var. scolymus]
MGLNMKVRDVLIDGLWCWPMEIWSKYGEILQLYLPPLIDGTKDKIRWKGKNNISSDFTVANVWRDIRYEENEVNWANMVWFSHGVPRHAFILWLAFRNSLRTKDRLGMWSMNLDPLCVLCENGMESHEHIFIACTYSHDVWNNMGGLKGTGDLMNILKRNDLSWDNFVGLMSNIPTSNSIWSIFQRIVLAAVIYFIWQERNIRMHGGEKRSAGVLANQIVEIVKLRLLGLKIKNNAQTLWMFTLGNLKIDLDHCWWINGIYNEQTDLGGDWIERFHLLAYENPWVGVFGEGYFISLCWFSWGFGIGYWVEDIREWRVEEGGTYWSFGVTKSIREWFFVSLLDLNSILGLGISLYHILKRWGGLVNLKHHPSDMDVWYPSLWIPSTSFRTEWWSQSQCLYLVVYSHEIHLSEPKKGGDGKSRGLFFNGHDRSGISILSLCCCRWLTKTDRNLRCPISLPLCMDSEILAIIDRFTHCDGWISSFSWWIARYFFQQDNLFRTLEAVLCFLWRMEFVGSSLMQTGAVSNVALSFNRIGKVSNSKEMLTENRFRFQRRGCVRDEWGNIKEMDYEMGIILGLKVVFNWAAYLNFWWSIILFGPEDMGLKGTIFSALDHTLGSKLIFSWAAYSNLWCSFAFFGLEDMDWKLIATEDYNDMEAVKCRMEDCGSRDEECLKRRVLEEAHLDYIYTQHHRP